MDDGRRLDVGRTGLGVGEKGSDGGGVVGGGLGG